MVKIGRIWAIKVQYCFKVTLKHQKSRKIETRFPKKQSQRFWVLNGWPKKPNKLDWGFGNRWQNQIK